MPLYLYRCECGEEKEKDHSMHDNPDIRCQCGKTMTRVPGFATVTFNGTGFYRTDRNA